ncbi:CHAT domain-containing protein [Aequorivita marina]|uniref:CHAT domain-containing protein n=1 Tax=Aequorivita marina TaxID=3073654 RepID=UPI002874589F|nr:CHAT domain-containing tetratricopeptide repeat protein [Aequorivita sp. S2608]MDS1297174.1 CHAT domain-containing tetratricopeptide repeat protein [Aequorivita sp. S2608]
MICKYQSVCFFFCALFFFGVVNGFSQEPNSTIEKIQTLIDQDSLAEARAIVQQHISSYKTEKKFDSLYKYIQFEGSFKLNNGDNAKAIKKAETLTQEIKTKASPHFIVEAIIEMGRVYSDAGQYQAAYNLLKSTTSFSKTNKDPKNTDLASLQYSLGYYASKLGDYPLSKKHYLNALRFLTKSRAEDFAFYQQLYNALGGAMWREAKMDSARFYFEEAVAVLKKTDQDDIMNQYYRPALLKMNLAVIWNALGKNYEAIKASQEAITGFQEYINQSKDEGRIFKTKEHLLATIDNMAAFYNTLGEFSRSQELIEYSYAQKKKIYNEANIHLIISHIILAQAKSASHDFEGAATNADKALKLLKISDDGNSFWEAAALLTRAAIYKQSGNIEKAAIFYEKGEAIYRNTMQGNHTKDFLDILMEESLFYAKNNKREKALTLAEETYTFTHTGDFKNTLQEFHHTINLARVHYELKDYNDAILYSNKALKFNILRQNQKAKASDSILIQYRKPQALYINAASKYYQQENKSAAFLKELLDQINEGISILEQRKKLINNSEDLSLLITENEEVFRFAKKVAMELYQTTKDETYLNKVITLHESSIYNRIRSRLNLRENVAFQNVPNKVIAREAHLKNGIISALNNSENENIQVYFEASRNWDVFLDSLKHRFPKYYKMRYAILEESITDLQQRIPKNTSVVRYLFIGENLYAFAVSSKTKKMFKLDFESVKDHISNLSNFQNSVEKISPLLFELYQSLWLPLENDVQTQKVVIIPDSDLFNLSFEMLTPAPIASFKEMANNSLLAKHDISYNFSLLLYRGRGKATRYSSNYIGFAPGFNKKMKAEYQFSINDSVKIDKTYLGLLPQPFSEDLAKQYAKTFDGTFFINEDASKDLFVNRAKEHKIIHIGTHAESNNISPELSRLIFAKQTDNSKGYGSNSLYSYEIYNIDLASNLAILTACETGKPTYQAGEGMTSLAHAFNYAGSESILTSLWKIDEESSAKIVRLFYNSLSEGMTKDEALRNAKLNYLKTSQGRTAAPQYWAGLVLIGNTAPIDLNNNLAWWWYALAGAIALILLLLVLKKER